jgi:phosphohistidine phosphatase
MQIYLLRHGIAEDSRAGLRDFDRALTSEGSQKLRRVLERARAAGAAPGAILTSPFRRAVQTAQLAAEILRYSGKIVQTRALTPDAPPAEAWGEIREYAEEPAVLLASHEPLMSSLAAFLLDSPTLVVDMKKAALVRIDSERSGSSPSGVLKWMLTPALAGD